MVYDLFFIYRMECMNEPFDTRRTNAEKQIWWQASNLNGKRFLDVKNVFQHFYNAVTMKISNDDT